MSNDRRIIESEVLEHQARVKGQGIFIACLSLIKKVLDRLSDFINLTEEEQDKAGIDLDDHRYE